MTEIQKERLNDLIEKLENGEYNQTKGRLRINDSYCISGVMCDLSSIGEWVEYDKNRTYRSFFYKTPNSFIHATSEPPKVSKHFGLSTSVSAILAQANDNGASFPRIAHALRTYLEDNGESPRWLKMLNTYYYEN